VLTLFGGAEKWGNLRIVGVSAGDFRNARISKDVLLIVLRGLFDFRKLRTG
jgi:hypothetical protein